MNDTKINFTKLLYNWYVILELGKIDFSVVTLIKHEQIIKEFWQNYDELKTRLQNVLYESLVDFLWLSVIDEARLLQERASVKYVEIPAQDEVRFCNENLKVLYDLFKNQEWDYCCGNTWAEVVSLLYKRENNQEWIESVIGLCYETGIILCSRDIIYDDQCERFFSFWKAKHDYNIMDVTFFWFYLGGIGLYAEVWELYKMLMEISIIKISEPKYALESIPSYIFKRSIDNGVLLTINSKFNKRRYENE